MDQDILKPNKSITINESEGNKKSSNDSKEHQPNQPTKDFFKRTAESTLNKNKR